MSNVNRKKYSKKRGAQLSPFFGMNSMERQVDYYFSMSNAGKKFIIRVKFNIYNYICAHIYPVKGVSWQTERRGPHVEVNRYPELPPGHVTKNAGEKNSRHEMHLH